MSAFFSWINNMSAFVLVRPSKVVPWKTGIGLCFSLKPQRWWAPLVCTVFCVYSISDPEAENEEWRCHPKAISYSSFSCSWHGVPHASITVSLSLSHSHTFWMCRGNAAAGFYVPSFMAASFLSPSLTCTSTVDCNIFLGESSRGWTNGEEEARRKVMPMFSITCIYIPLSFVPFFGIQWGKLLHIFIYIYLCFYRYAMFSYDD